MKERKKEMRKGRKKGREEGEREGEGRKEGRKKEGSVQIFLVKILPPCPISSYVPEVTPP